MHIKGMPIWLAVLRNIANLVLTGPQLALGLVRCVCLVNVRLLLQRCSQSNVY